MSDPVQVPPLEFEAEHGSVRLCAIDHNGGACVMMETVDSEGERTQFIELDLSRAQTETLSRSLAAYLAQTHPARARCVHGAVGKCESDPPKLAPCPKCQRPRNRTDLICYGCGDGCDAPAPKPEAWR